VIAKGKVISWTGNTVVVRLESGKTVIARSNGRSYAGIGATVYVAITRTGMAVLI